MADNKLSWTELRRALASRAGVSEKEANAFLSAFNTQLTAALKSDKQVKVNGLGTFKLQAVAPRKSVNVTTGEQITIEGYNKIAFVPEAGVRELVEKGVKNERVKELKNEGEVVDPLKKLGAQAEEIVDLLGELGQDVKVDSRKKKAQSGSESRAGTACHRTGTCTYRRTGTCTYRRTGRCARTCTSRRTHTGRGKAEKEIPFHARYAHLCGGATDAAAGRIFLPAQPVERMDQ